MKISATIQNSFKTNIVEVKTNDSSKSISISSKDNGFGSMINGGELFLLAIATCYCNDIYREANKKNIQVEKVEVVAFAEFGAEGEPCSDITYQVKITSNASQSSINDLINHTDKVAEIHNSIRRGTKVILKNVEM